jgi:UDPglucose 6-dehydrogenase
MEDKGMKSANCISIIGLGYVGLCLAGSLSKLGYKTICVDIDDEKIKSLNSGLSPIYEPGLSELIREGVNKGLIEATTQINRAIDQSYSTFICVGTPSNKEGKIDLKYIKTVSRNIGEALEQKQSYHVIAVKSTVIPGTTDSIVLPIIEKYSKKKVGMDFGICMIPEFLKEGSAVKDFFNPDKIVIGSFDDKSKDTMYEIFSHFWEENYGKNVFLFCDLRTAEMIKYANNSFVAVKISFINEMANLSEEFGTDIKIISKAIGMDKRISPLNLNSGLGFGGSCLPKDVKALYLAGKSVGYESKILKSVLDVNYTQPIRPIHILEENYPSLENKFIALLGLSFKPGTDDIRYAPSIIIAEYLIKSGAKIQAYDPVAINNFKKISTIGNSDQIKYFQNPLDALNGTDAVIIVTEWDEFRHIENHQFIKLMKTPLIIDGRRIFNPAQFENSKIRYFGLGFSKSKDFIPE